LAYRGQSWHGVDERSPLSHESQSLPLACDVLAGGKPRLQRYVEVRDLAFDFVPGRNYRRLGGLLNKQAGGLDLLGPKPMPGDVDDIVDSTQDTIIAIGRPGATKRPVLLSTRYESNPLGLAISLLRASHRN
jgi:hypothetical protein